MSFEMGDKMKLLDVVTLTEDMPELKLYRGQVGTIVEEYEPQVFEVEFSDMRGRTYALETLKADRLMVLRYQPFEERLSA
jgi:hypothetical protein